MAYYPTRLAKGTVQPNGLRSIAIRFPTIMFDVIEELAYQDKVTFAEKVRELCENELKRCERKVPSVE